MSLLKKITHPTKWYVIGVTLLFYDALTILGTFFVALYISYGCEYQAIPTDCLDSYLRTIPFYLVICLFVYSLFKFYNCIWRLVSYYELSTFTLVVLLLSFCYFIIGVVYPFPLPKRYYIIGGWITIMACPDLSFCISFSHISVFENAEFHEGNAYAESSHADRSRRSWSDYFKRCDCKL